MLIPDSYHTLNMENITPQLEGNTSSSDVLYLLSRFYHFVQIREVEDIVFEQKFLTHVFYA